MSGLKDLGPTTALINIFAVVAGVSWSPIYDLHASTVNGKTSSTVSLVHGAHITQKTGEDWSNVALTLSTGTSQALKILSIPTLSPLRLAAVPPPRPNSRSRCDHFYHPCRHPIARTPPIPHPPPSTYYSHNTTDVDIPLAAEPVYNEPVQWATNEPGSAATVLDGNPLALAYRIQGAAKLPSDGLPHRVMIATLTLEADIKYVYVPRMENSALIEASVKNTSEYELLEGSMVYSWMVNTWQKRRLG